MKIAVAQLNPTVGDLKGNSQRIIAEARAAREQGADLVVFPELSVVGYPPQDLLENSLFLNAVERTLEHIAAAVPQDMGVIVGAPERNGHHRGKPLRNAALLFEAGKVVGRAHKALLPTYDVFDELRHFEGGGACTVISWRGLKLGLHICEDMWSVEEAEIQRYDRNPVDELMAQGPDVLINVSASPFSLGRHQVRTRLIEGICRRHRVPFILANQVGANTEIIFDGDSRVHAADGTLLHCATPFQEDLLLWDMDAPAEPCTYVPDDIADLHDALVLGIRDYFRKTGVFTKAVIGLSGGIDSAVTCALAVEALGPDQVVGVTMPSAISSEGSVADSEALARNLGITFREIPIKPAVDAFDRMLSDAFAGTAPGVAEENIQSRARGLTLMALSNKFDYLLLSTGNKSEMAVGYVTLYGDTNGGVAVLSDVLKTRVYELAHYINKEADRALIPQNTIDKPPSAELREGQEDTDSLPPYDQLDAILRRYVEEQHELDRIVDETGFDPAMVHDVLRMVDRNEYKRRQAPPGLRVTAKAFGMGRRLPIVKRWDRTVLREIAAGMPAA